MGTIRSERLTLDDVDDLAVALEDVDKPTRLLLPDEDVAAVAAADNVLVVQTVEVDVLRGVDVAMAVVVSGVIRTGYPLAGRRSRHRPIVASVVRVGIRQWRFLLIRVVVRLGFWTI
jgi:hypothetical protein